MIEFIGWIGSFLLAFCGIPQLIKGLIEPTTIKKISIWFLLTWFFGELFIMIYTFVYAFKWPLIFNYLINLSTLIGILSIYFLYNKEKDVNLIKLFYFYINNIFLLKRKKHEHI